MKLQSKSGFSLVELMVVVAIIGILATIAVPNFQRFQARAKQAEAKTELSGIHTAQKAFIIEYNSYTRVLPITGFIPEDISNATYAAIGNTRNYGSSAGAVAVIANAASDCPNCPQNTSVAYPGLYVSSCDTVGLIVGNFGAANTTSVVAPVTTVTAAGVVSTFTAVATGCPGGKATAVANSDVWSIDDARVLRNVRSGLGAN